MNPDIINRARRYLAVMPPAIAGSGGDVATLKTAVALVKGFNLPPAQAFPLLAEWNASCVPPWTEADLRRKLASAVRSPGHSGYLLEKDSTRHATRHATSGAPAGPVDERAEKAAKRQQWPDFRTPSPADLTAIAALRAVSPEAAYLIGVHRHLWRCRWRDVECLAIRCGTFAQVRRMDGLPFTRPGGQTIKALNLPGSEGSFLNPGGLGAPGLPVILTEGAVSILEATEALCRADLVAGRLHAVAVLAAVSAGSRFKAEQTGKLSGRRVRIIPDADPAGQEAAAVWTASLRTAGCSVDCIRLPNGSKDLGEALRHLPADDSYWHQLLTF